MQFDLSNWSENVNGKFRTTITIALVVAVVHIFPFFFCCFLFFFFCVLLLLVYKMDPDHGVQGSSSTLRPIENKMTKASKYYGINFQTN